MRWCCGYKLVVLCSGQSILLTVGWSKFEKLVFTLWVSQLPCWTLSIKGIVWRTSRQVRLLCRWARCLIGWRLTLPLRLDWWQINSKTVKHCCLLAEMLWQSKCQVLLGTNLWQVLIGSVHKSRPQSGGGGLCSADKRGRRFRCGRPHFFAQKTLDLKMSAQTRGERGSIFRGFVWTSYGQSLAN